MDELNREILINHLFDLRALEIAKVKLSTTLSKNNTKIKQLGYSRYYKKPNSSFVIIVPLIVMSALVFGFFIISQTIMHQDLFDRRLKPEYQGLGLNGYSGSAFYEYVPSHPEFDTYVNVCTIITLILVIIAFAVTLITVTYSKKEYNKKVKDDYERVRKEKQDIDMIKSENNEVSAKLKEVNTLLRDSYSINIIPQQFRTVQGICYLYDYMSTSQQSLNSAFLNYNVNQINVGINKMIEQQSEMILQQSVTNARLEIMEGHGKKMIDQLASIEQNSEIAARYSAITASHAKANTFFEGYKFFNTK